MDDEGTLDHVRRMARAVLWFASIGFASVNAGADPVSPLAPFATPILGSEPSRAGDDEPELPPLAAVNSLRLTLTFDASPAARLYPGCASLEEPSGNSINGFPIQRYTFLPLAPRLVLHGFSSAGCPVDAGVGGGLTYSMPFMKDVWLVPSTGFYSLQRPGLPPITATAARVDVVKSSTDGRSLSVGVGIKYGTSDSSNALAFGGRF